MSKLETIGGSTNPLYERVTVEVPDEFRHDDAYQRWEQCGGQVRDFNGETVDVRQLDFVRWVLRQEGGRFPQTDSKKTG